MVAHPGNPRRPSRRRRRKLTSLDETLAAVGNALADGVGAAVPAWVTRSVASVLDAWQAAGGTIAVAAGDRAAVLARAEAVGRDLGARAGAELRRLASADVDAMHDTPLAVVRRLVAGPTAVLTEAGVAPVQRDRLAEEQFPDDRYDLTPGSLAVLDPELGELALAWGAAKAAAHRARHRDPDSP